MIGRIMEEQMVANPQMEQQFTTVQEALQAQREENAKIEKIVDERVRQMWLDQAKKRALEAATSEEEEESDEASYYDEEDDVEKIEETKENDHAKLNQGEKSGESDLLK